MKLEGTFRADRHGNSDIKVKGVVQPEPYITGDYLTVDEAHKHIATQLYNFGVTEDTDGHYVSQLVAQYLVLQEAFKVFQEDGVNGKVGCKLAVSLMTEAQREMRMLYTQFRVAPGERTPQHEEKEDVVGNLLSFKPS